MKKYLTMFLSLCMFFSLTGCNSTTGEEKNYTATAKGFGGDVQVTVTMSGDKIVSITAKGDDETKDVGGKALEELPQKIIDAQSAEVDAITGATVTSNAIKTAVKSCLNEAKGVNAGEVKMKPGTYTATSKGYGGQITVHVTVTEDTITDIQVDDSKRVEYELSKEGNNAYTHYDEAPQIFMTVKEAIPERVLQAQSVNIDAVSGATASSQGVLSAIKLALEEAGADLSVMFNSIPEKSTLTESYDADVVVIGGGTSGSIAAARASENGAKVVIMEKSGRIGGTGSISSGPAVVNNEMQLEAGMEFDVDSFVEEWAKQTHYSANRPLFTKFINSTSDTVDWLSEHGFVWELPSSAVVNKSATSYSAWWMMYVPYHYSVNTMTVYNYFKEMTSNVDTILYETTASEILTDETGSIKGVKGTKWDGTEITVNASKVIVCTGGIAGSSELMQKYNGDSDYLILGLQQNTGDGLSMMLNLGAKEEHIGGACTHVVGLKNVPEGFDSYTTSIPYTLAIAGTTLKVNKEGTRFMDENGIATSLTQACNIMFAQGSSYWTLVSEKQIEELKEGGLAATGIEKTPAGTSFTYEPLPIDYSMDKIEEILDAGVETGMSLKADSLENLAKEMEVSYDTLQKNVSQYNEYCKLGKDEMFNKPENMLDYLGEENQTWYAIKTYPSVYSALGGVKVDEYMRVLDRNNQVIDGLYTAGIDAIGNIFDGVAYTDLMGMAVGWGLTSGKFAADSATLGIDAVK